MNLYYIIKKILVFSLFVISLIVMQQFLWNRATDAFLIKKITYPIKNTHHLETKNFDLIKKKLNQDFFYFAKGHHAFVFESADKKYILKFIRYHKFTPPFWTKLFSLQKKYSSKTKRLHFIENSHRIADKKLSQETAIIFLHLEKTSNLQQKICLIDKIGRKNHISADEFGFVLQKKISLFKNILPRVVQKNNHKEIKQIIRAYFNVVASRAKKHIVNKDRKGMESNYGIMANQSFEIDIGSFIFDDNLKNTNEQLREIHACTIDMRKWMKKNYPHGVQLFDHEWEQFKQLIH